MNRPTLKSILLFLTPIALLACFLFLKSFDHQLYKRMIREDGIVENLTFAGYLISFYFAARLASSFKKEGPLWLFFSYVVLAFTLLFFAGEEISWGQRLIGFRPPQFFLENSFQYETNIHNLKQIREIDYFFAAKAATLIGIYGGLAWLLFSALRYLGWDRPHNTCVPYLVPQWFVSSFFLVSGLYFSYMAYLLPHYQLLNIRYREQEIMELILCLGFLSFVFSNWKLRRREISSQMAP